MRRGGRASRGERERVARRVRAVVAAPGAPVGASVTEQQVPVGSPWLPSDDFGSALPSAPLTAPPPEPAVPERADRAPGLLGRLARLAIRADPGRRGALAIGLAVLVAAVLTGGWVLSTRPHALAVTGTGAGPAAVASARSAAASGGSLTPDPPSSPTASVPMLVVDVAGKVRHPGLYRLPAGSRVNDAVRAAGGARPGVELTNLNLAAKIVDGQQIAVGLPGAGPAGGSGTGPGGVGPAVPVPVDLNAATLEQLETLPGVGPVLGQHILDWRMAHGPFVRVDQLREVSGIGDVKFAALRARVTT